MTQEYGRAIGNLLKPDGLLAANIIGGMRGGACQDVLQALDAAYRTSLPYGWYKNELGQPEERANYIVAYSRNLTAKPSGYVDLPQGSQAAYTDNYAPAERLYYNCQQSAH